MTRMARAKDLTWVCTNPLCRGRGDAVQSAPGGGDVLACDFCDKLLWDLSRSKGPSYRGYELPSKRVIPDPLTQGERWWAALRKRASGRVVFISSGETQLQAINKAKHFIDALKRA